MANDHPFQVLFETLGRPPVAHTDSVNRQAYETLSDILTVPVERPGRCILLRAPRAGHGKTHLLSRIQHQLGASHEFIPLHPAFGCRIDALSVIDDALRRLLRPLPASGGLCVLDLVTRRLFASALQPLVGSGEVPCQDREGALAALRSRPIETFDFHHPNAVTAHWARENFEVLGQRLSMELAQRCDLPIREISFWVGALFRFAVTPVENPGRVATLAESAHSVDPGNGVAMERLEALLGLLSLLTRVVLVADDLEGFSTDDTAALHLAAFLGSLRQSVERLDVILSLNMDIWQSAFLPRLSGGLADRLSEVLIELTPLNQGEMVALLESRVPGLGDRVLDRIDLNEAGTHARGLIRAAGIAWLRATAMDAANEPALDSVRMSPAVQDVPEVVEVPQGAAATPDPVAEVSATAPVISTPEPVARQFVATAADSSQIPASPFLAAPASWPTPEFNTAPRAAIVSPADLESEAVISQAPALQSVFEAASQGFIAQDEAVIVRDSPAFEPTPPIFEAEHQASIFNPPPASHPAAVGDSGAVDFFSQPQWRPDSESAAGSSQAPVIDAVSAVFIPQDEAVIAQDSPAFEPAPPFFVAEPQAPAFNSPPVNHYSQIVEQDTVGYSLPPQWQANPEPAAAMSQSPAAQPVFEAAPPVFTAEPQVPAVDSSFQSAPPAVAAALQAAASERWVGAPVDSPFQAMVPEMAPATPAFDAAAAQVFPSNSEPNFVVPQQTGEPLAPPPAAADTDRVDELLRQFRERYGRGSL